MFKLPKLSANGPPGGTYVSDEKNKPMQMNQQYNDNQDQETEEIDDALLQKYQS